MKDQTISAAFSVIRELGALCSTQGINQKTQDLANEQIQELITKIIKPFVLELSAESKGIIVNS